MSHQFIGFLRRSIKAYRMCDTIFFRKRNFSIQSINTTGTGINQVFHLVMTTTFQYIQETIYITFHISIRILYGITYSSLSRKIYDLIKIFIGKKHLHGLFVFQIHTYKTKVLKENALHKSIPVYSFLLNTQYSKTTIF